MNKLLIFKIITVVLLSVMAISASGQNNTLYNMNRIPQANMLNPAIQHPCNTYVEFPALGSVDFSLSNNAISFEDAIFVNPQQNDSLYFNLDGVENSLKDNNYIRAQLQYSIFGFGFRKKNWYFTFNLSQKLDTRFSFTKDLITIYKGNWQYDQSHPEYGTSREWDLSSLGVNATSYTEIAFGASKKIDNQLTVGARAKILLGNSAVETQSSDIKVTTSGTFPHQVTLSGNYEVNLTAPFMEVHTDENNHVDSIITNDELSVSDYIINGAGFGFDLGAIYKISERFAVSASILDIGFIRWNDNTYNFKTEGEYSYDLVDISEYLNFYELETFQEIGDSLDVIFSPTNSSNNFTTWLIPKIHLGGNFYVSNFFDVGLLSRFEIFDKAIHPSLTLSSNLRFWKSWAVTLSYSMMENSYNNIGAGISMKVGPMQLYFVHDNMLGAPIYPTATKNLNFRFGINLLFGCSKKVLDLPSILDYSF